MNFGQKLEKLRNQLGMNFVQIGKELGLSPDTISGYEKNASANISIQNVKKIADYFNVSIDYLLSDDENTLEITEVNTNYINEIDDLRLTLEELKHKIYQQNDIKFDGKDMTERSKNCAIDGIDVLINILQSNI